MTILECSRMTAVSRRPNKRNETWHLYDVYSAVDDITRKRIWYLMTRCSLSCWMTLIKSSDQWFNETPLLIAVKSAIFICSLEISYANFAETWLLSHFISEFKTGFKYLAIHLPTRQNIWVSCAVSLVFLAEEYEWVLETLLLCSSSLLDLWSQTLSWYGFRVSMSFSMKRPCCPRVIQLAERSFNGDHVTLAIGDSVDLFRVSMRTTVVKLSMNHENDCSSRFFTWLLLQRFLSRLKDDDINDKIRKSTS